MEASLTLIAAASVAMYIRGYEKKQIVVEKAVLIALLSSISTVGRVLFAAIPSAQPSSFIIIAAGICFGAEIGVMTGVITAIASNIVLGHGPWTIWQMLCWGAMGYLSGVLSKPLSKSKALLVLYGFAWGFVFGWVMNLWFVLGEGGINIAYFISGAVLSFYFDLAHAVTNAVLLFFAGDMLIKRFSRIGRKYGIL